MLPDCTIFLLPRETFPSCVSSEVIHNNYSVLKCKNFPRSLVSVREKRVIDHWYPDTVPHYMDSRLCSNDVIEYVPR